MRARVRLLGSCLVFALLLVLVVPAANAGRKDQAKESADAPPAVTVQRWLVLGPAVHPWPVFHDAKKGGFDLAELLDETALPGDVPDPRDGESVAWYTAGDVAWSTQSAKGDGLASLSAPAEEQPAVAWVAVYVSVDRWRSFEAKLLGKHPRRAWLDGAPLASGGAKSADDEVQGTVKLTTGKHLVLVQTIFDPDRDADWSVGLSLSGDKEDDSPPDLSFSLDPERPVKLADVLDPPDVSSLSVAPDGKQVALTVRRVVPGTHDSESWIEIRRTSDGSLAQSWRGALDAGSVAWSPDGRYLSYVATAPGEKKGSTLFLYDLETSRVVPLLESVQELGGYLWSPTGRSIVYTTTVKAEKDERGVKLLEGVMDRWAGYRDKQFLHLVGVPGGAHRQLTAGELSSSAVAFAPDGKRLLFTRRIETLERRPYGTTELWELNLESFAATKLRDFLWFSGADYSPDGKRLLVAADATAFGEIGLNLSEDVIPNSYDGQLYLWDPASDEAEAITRDFDPAVSSVVWSHHDGRIYLTAEDRDVIRLYRYEGSAGKFAELETGYASFRGMDLAAAAPVVVGLGSSPWTPEAVVAVDLATERARVLEHPADAWFASISRGTMEAMDFTASSGRTIAGRVYLPQGFDPDRLYPAIVYYYGGTSPVTREFGGRYPKEWWAANGYVVYVLQPSGATGFGQDWSATHVNDWGKVATTEIIEGTQAFLEAHPYVDPLRVGCIGASYGGFMTMLLSTQTEIFGAAVSHAGISSLASYWGEGYWGALYSAVATAEAFPWNRKDVYVDQSPIYSRRPGPGADPAHPRHRRHQRAGGGERPVLRCLEAAGQGRGVPAGRGAEPLHHGAPAARDLVGQHRGLVRPLVEGPAGVVERTSPGTTRRDWRRRLIP